MIRITGVSKIFAAGPREVRAVDNVDLAISKGDFVLILGRSGSGKSTLLSMLAGLTPPTTGEVRIKDQDVGTLPEAGLALLRAEEIGFVFQFSGLIPTITAAENVMVPTLFTSNGARADARADDILGRVGMLDRADAYPRTLSSGEMKRVAIARALINNPSILIADEPTGDLDAETEYEIMELFRQINREGTTIIMVTHNPDLVPYATRTFEMNKGVLRPAPGGQGAGLRGASGAAGRP